MTPWEDGFTKWCERMEKTLPWIMGGLIALALVLAYGYAEILLITEYLKK